MQEYEKNLLIEYVGHDDTCLIFTNDNDVNIDARAIRDKSENNYFDLLLDMIRIEEKEVEAFQEALAIKDHYE